MVENVSIPIELTYWVCLNDSLIDWRGFSRSLLDFKLVVLQRAWNLGSAQLLLLFFSFLSKPCIHCTSLRLHMSAYLCLTNK